MKRAFSFNYKIIKKGNKENDPSLRISATSLRAIDRVKISPMIIHTSSRFSAFFGIYLLTRPFLHSFSIHPVFSSTYSPVQTFVCFLFFLLSSKIKRSLIRSRRKAKKKKKKKAEHSAEFLGQLRYLFTEALALQLALHA